MSFERRGGDGEEGMVKARVGNVGYPRVKDDEACIAIQLFSTNEERKRNGAIYL